MQISKISTDLVQPDHSTYWDSACWFYILHMELAKCSACNPYQHQIGFFDTRVIPQHFVSTESRSTTCVVIYGQLVTELRIESSYVRPRGFSIVRPEVPRLTTDQLEQTTPANRSPPLFKFIAA